MGKVRVLRLFVNASVGPLGEAIGISYKAQGSGIFRERSVFILAKNIKLSIGIENFVKIRTEGFYYVDKTGLIKELLNNWGELSLGCDQLLRKTAHKSRCGTQGFLGQHQRERHYPHVPA